MSSYSKIKTDCTMDINSFEDLADFPDFSQLEDFNSPELKTMTPPDMHEPVDDKAESTLIDTQDKKFSELRTGKMSRRKETQKRRRLTPDETRILTRIFERNQKPNSILRHQIATQLGMSSRNIQIWFQNRRAKLKKEGEEAAERSLAQERRLSYLHGASASLGGSIPILPAGFKAPPIQPSILPVDGRIAYMKTPAVPQPPTFVLHGAPKRSAGLMRRKSSFGPDSFSKNAPSFDIGNMDLFSVSDVENAMLSDKLFDDSLLQGFSTEEFGLLPEA